MPRTGHNPLIILFHLLFAVYSVAAIYHLTRKPGLPQEWTVQVPVTIDGENAATADETEFIASAHNIGDAVKVGFPGTDVTPAEVRLVHSNGPFLVIIDILVALSIAGLGVAARFYQPREQAAMIFHLASLTTAAALIGTKTIYSVGPRWLGDALCIQFFLAYTLLGALFVHFALIFPRAWTRNPARFMPWVYALTAIVGLVGAWSYLQAAHEHSLGLFRQLAAVTMVQNSLVFLLLAAGVAGFVISYRRARVRSESQKLRWIFYGLLIGPAPFILLWVLPEALGGAPLVPEWIFKLTLVLIPLTFAASILKYRVMDIDLLINRSAVYGIVLGSGAVGYVGILALAARLIASLTHEASVMVSTVAAAMLALLFDPMRRHVQRFVDRRFFRVQYDFREAQRAFIGELKQCLDVGQVARLLVRRISGILAVHRIAYCSLRQPGNRIQIIAQEGFERLEARGVRFEAGQLRTGLRLPVALAEQIEPGVPIDNADQQVFRRWGVALAFPILSEQSGEVTGFLVLGDKKSGMRFTAEDMDLLGTMTSQASLSIQRISLQQKLLLEHAEAERLEELSRLKTYFVSSVSHDLKTPLTSIRMFAELLRTGTDIPPERAREYFAIIEGESERLTRLINTVLDFSRIERGIKEYSLREVDLNEIVERTLCSLQYQFTMGKFSVRSELVAGICPVQGDPDALTEAMINLLSNAMKYSGEHKEISVTTSVERNTAIVRIADRGIGIAADELPRVFEPFYQATSGKRHGAGGTGLGLSVVKHIIDGHQGSISIESIPGSGTTVTIHLPLTDDVRSGGGMTGNTPGESASGMTRRSENETNIDH